MMNEYSGTHETLAQAAAAIVYRQFVACLVIWIVIGFPISCQQHGTMLLFDFGQHNGHHHSANPSAPECSLRQHDSAPRDAMTLTLLGTLPNALVLNVPDLFAQFEPLLMLQPSQVSLRPPVPPPRSA